MCVYNMLAALNPECNYVRHLHHKVRSNEEENYKIHDRRIL